MPLIWNGPVTLNAFMRPWNSNCKSSFWKHGMLGWSRRPEHRSWLPLPKLPWDLCNQTSNCWMPLNDIEHGKSTLRNVDHTDESFDGFSFLHVVCCALYPSVFEVATQF